MWNMSQGERREDWEKGFGKRRLKRNSHDLCGEWFGREMVFRSGCGGVLGVVVRLKEGGGEGKGLRNRAWALLSFCPWLGWDDR